MRPQLRLAAALAALAVVGVLATFAGEARSRRPDDDPRRSTFVYGPGGASAWAEALVRLGVDVERQRADGWPGLAGAAPTTLMAVLDPATALDAFEGGELAAHVAAGGHLLVAGPATATAMRCLGYEVVRRRRDSLQAHPRGRPPAPDDPWIAATLRPTGRAYLADTVEAVSGVVAECRVPPVAAVDTLLVARGGRAVALRVRTGAGGTALIVADGALFSNRRLRATAAGPFALGVVAGRYDRVLVDEYHHGFGTGGNLLSALLEWSARSPWGWALWQLALAAVALMLAGALRFGPPVPLGERRRRSPLEHVRALATALAAARGHDVAIRLLVTGLRRRLAKAGGADRGDPREWLAGLTPHLRTERARTAAATLTALTVPPQPASSVLAAANAVEDLWEELRP